MGVLVLIYLLVVYVAPRPASVKPEGWRLTGVFLATVAGLILQVLPAGALVLMAVTLSAVVGGLTIQQSLAGYADPTVWLVQAAFFISNALINTGLARRIALFFIRLFGKSSLGVSYALCLTDTVLATIIPSNGARSGGVTLPIVRSIAELYGSHPGATSALLGSFLITSVYQGICVSSAMFFTGQASNPLAAKIATEFGGVAVTWFSWFSAAVVPGVVSLAVVPWVVFKLNPPEIKETPKAAEFARDELVKQGPMSSNEKILSVIFAGVCGLWVTSGWHGIDVTVTALFGAIALLLTGVLSWADVIAERAGWDIFVWYGGLLLLGKELNKTGVTSEFAKAIGGVFGDIGWFSLFLIALVIYFYAHYGFASITAHLLAMYPAFLAALTAKGAPLGILVYAFACFANLSAGLTTYGTTPSPMFYGTNFVEFKAWWRIGFIVSLVNFAIWSTVG
ncbi:MAG: anion permease, partial [Bryobacteraceae bacterium]|nr:anion permease [Bryobacteraceae bacterium]